MTGQFKYSKGDFPALPIRLNHLTIYLNVLGEVVEASNCLDMTALQALDRIELDARDLAIIQVEWLESPSPEAGAGRPLQYEYLEEKNKLAVHLPRSVNRGERFLVRTITRCVPSDHILEGIYRDTTPSGAPQQYVSQCQQWGFQRIMPIFDDCRAKCTMTTTIEADAAYTHLISNGNISRAANPEGRPRPKPDDPSRQIITYENAVPMAPYLFLVCAGTWDELVDHVTYPSGGTVRLEYLVPPGRAAEARVPMDILKEAVLWIGATQGYEYTADTYRTICMTKSNFGGMENVGNTTIVTDAALIHEHTGDQSLIYAHAVIVHEFEHNQCGSETTMETPFDVWLNEAYTVDVERQFTASVFDPAFVRLNQVDAIRNPLLGPLAIEDSGAAGRIVREGFNNPDELIDGVTYGKAAEVIRMLRLILGGPMFAAGKELYFSRYRHSNANTDQFFQCFEEVSGRSLEQFKRGWLYRIGYPKVTAASEYNPATKELKVRFRQNVPSGEAPFCVPIEAALVDGNAQTVPGTQRVFQLTNDRDVLVFNNVPHSDVLASLNRDCSFYGTFTREDVTAESLVIQARADSNTFNRVEAFRQLTDRERIKILLYPNAAVDKVWLGLYGELLGDDGLPPALKAYFLRIDEQPLDRGYCTWFPELVMAMEKLMHAVNRAYLGTLLERFLLLDIYGPRKSPRDGIQERLLKNVLLSLIAVDDSPDSHRLILDHYERAVTPAERVAPLILLNRSSAPERRQLLEETYRDWHGHLSGYANYLRVVAAGTNPDVFDMIEEEIRRPTFDVSQPTWSRTLLLTMAANTKMVWTEQGIDWVAAKVVWLSPINDVTASRLLNTFQHYRRLKPELQGRVKPALERIIRHVPADVSPTVHAQATAYLGKG